MINVGTLSKLRRLVRRDGLSVREASKKLGIARNTAARWLAMDEMVEPEVDAPEGRKEAEVVSLDQFRK